MSIQLEYDKYRASGGTETIDEYGRRLEGLKTYIGHLITNGVLSEEIFKHLKTDIPTAITFSRVSKGLYQSSRTVWFLRSAREFVLRYVQRGTSYGDFLCQVGFEDMFILALKAAGVALTITASMRASVHSSRIPPDAPIRTVTMSGGREAPPREVPSIDHPEALNAELWGSAALATGVATAVGIGYGLTEVLRDVNLGIVFSKSEEAILGSDSVFLKLLTPEYCRWKRRKVKDNLAANPPNWQQHPELSREVCPLSGDFRLFPVKDECGHRFDFRALRAYQLDPNTQHPLDCPISRKRALSTLEFDKGRFDKIQRLIRTLSA